MARILNEGTQQAKRFITDFENASAEKLGDVYGNWSDKKQKAYDECLKVCNDMEGRRFRITSHSFNFFTVGFLFERDNEIWLRIETHANSYEMKFA